MNDTQEQRQLPETSIHDAQRVEPVLNRGKRSSILSLLGAAGVVLLKGLKPLLIALKSLKFAALLKSGLTMILAIWVYAIAWGWHFALAFILLLFVHEMGHVYALRQYGIRSSVPIFIPFMGAFIAMKEMPKNVEIEAWTGIAGPLVGTGGATLCWSAGLYTGNPFWFAVAYTGFFLNLFNMIPVRPLDGGRVVAAILPKLWGLGFIIILVWLIRSFNPILLIILLLAGRNLYTLWKQKGMADEQYYTVSRKGRMQLTFCYFGLLAFLAFGMAMTQVAV